MRGAKTQNLCARFALAAAVLAAVSMPARAETEAMDSQVAVVAPGSFYKVRDLYFGVISSSLLPGTVTVAPNGTRTATGGVTLIGNSHHPAEFAGMKPTQANRPVRMRVASNTVLLTGPGTPMVASLFRANTNPGIPLSTITRNYQVQQTSNGTFALSVGATLTVKCQPAARHLYRNLVPDPRLPISVSDHMPNVPFPISRCLPYGYNLSAMALA
jgi:hypothetical protein